MLRSVKNCAKIDVAHGGGKFNSALVTCINWLQQPLVNLFKFGAKTLDVNYDETNEHEQMFTDYSVSIRFVGDKTFFTENCKHFGQL